MVIRISYISFISIFSLSIGTPSNTVVAAGGSLAQVHGTRSLATVVWFGLTLVRHVLSFEHTMLDQNESSAAGLLSETPASASKATSTPSASMLASLLAYVDPGSREHYMAVLLTYLRYPFHTGLCRSAVTLLKWLTQVSQFFCCPTI